MTTLATEQPPVEVWRVWEELPRERQMGMIREAVAERFGDGVKAERTAVYITAQLVAINSAALGRLFNRDVPWTLRALHDLGERSKRDTAFAGQVAGVQEAITDRLAAPRGTI
jgi:hypothetical protein